MRDEIKDLIESKNIDLIEMSEAHDLYEALDYDGSLHLLVDGMIDIYNHDLRVWAVDNYQYIEEAIEEGLCEGESDFHKLIQCGQYVYYRLEVEEQVSCLFDEVRTEQIVERVEDLCDEFEFEIVSWGLAPNPNGYCYEYVGDEIMDKEAEAELSDLLSSLSRGDIKL